MAKTIDVSKVPAKVTLENVKENGEALELQLFKTNLTVVLEAGDKLIFTAKDSKELLYLTLLAKEGELTVTVAE